MGIGGVADCGWRVAVGDEGVNCLEKSRARLGFMSLPSGKRLLLLVYIYSGCVIKFNMYNYCNILY